MENAMEIVPTDCRAALAREIDRLREAEEDTLDYHERRRIGAERAQKERELADLPTDEPRVAGREASPLNGATPAPDGAAERGDEVAIEMGSAPTAISASKESKPTARAPVANAGNGAHAGAVAPMPNATGLPVISTYQRPTRDVAGDAYRALLSANAPPWAYVHGGALMKLRVSADGRARIEPITLDMLSCRLHEIADFQGNHGVPRTAPQAVVKYVLNADVYPDLPVLTGVVSTPVLRPDGTVLSAAGYDAKSGLFLSTTAGLNVPGIPDAPTRDDVFHARDFLLDFITEFPFADAASRSNYMGAWLTPVIRPAVIGCAPLFVFDKPESGTGATLLAMLIKATAEGSVAIDGVPVREEELEKRITSTLLAGTSVIIWDNVDHPLYAGTLSRLLTSSEWNGRILGVSRMVHLPQQSTWIVTGNNVCLAGDVPRRVVSVRLDASIANPEGRTGFKHVLPNAVLEQRGAVIGGLLTLARGWFVAGCPSAPVPAFGSFEEWARICSGILAYAQVPGFLENRDHVNANAEDGRAEWGVFIEALHGLFGSDAFTAAQVADRLAMNDGLLAAAPPVVRNAVKGREDFTQALGHLFRTQRDKVFNASDSRRLRFIRNAKNDRTNVAQWQVVVIA